jgi:hypothetical protein
LKLPLGLLFPLTAQCVHDEGCWGDLPSLAVFRGYQAFFLFAAISLQPLELLIDQQAAPAKVHMIPCQTQDFSLSHSGKEGHQKNSFVGMPLNSGHKAADRNVIHRLQLFAFHSGQGTGISGIKSQIADGYSLLERFVEDAVDQMDRFRRKWLDVSCGRMEQTVIKCLGIRSGQCFQLNGAQRGHDVIFDVGLVSFCRSGLYMP